MLNLDETLELKIEYFEQKDFFYKGICYSAGILTVIEILRAQVAEINLLQLVPGFYLFLLFSSFVVVVIFSDLLIRASMDLDTKKVAGAKTILKFKFGILLKFSFLLLFSTFIIILNTIIPISLDSFNSYGEKTLENLWSFDEVINLEITLLVILLFLSQLPVIITGNLLLEKVVKKLPTLWKPLTLLILIISGFLTPTIDGYTQLSFSFSAFSLYIIIINFLQKRILIKIGGNAFLGF